MGNKSKYLILLFLTAVLANEVEDKFKAAKIDTDLNISAPKEELKVTYGETEIALGNSMSQSATSQKPNVKFDSFGSGKLATLIMLDPDAPSPTNPIKRSWLHWLVTNIDGNDINSGDNTVAYNGPTPPAESGPHRYVILVLEQTDHIKIADAPERASFNVADFIKSNSLKQAEYGNFYTVEVKA